MINIFRRKESPKFSSPELEELLDYVNNRPSDEPCRYSSRTEAVLGIAEYLKKSIPSGNRDGTVEALTDYLAENLKSVYFRSFYSQVRNEWNCFFIKYGCKDLADKF